MSVSDESAATSDVDERAREVEGRMTDEERFSLLVSVMGTNDVVTVRDERIPEGTPMSAGYVPGVERLGEPVQLMSDATLGVTNPGYREGDTATALPAGVALRASFNPELRRASGEMLGREARSRGFNVQLAGGFSTIFELMAGVIERFRVTPASRFAIPWRPDVRPSGGAEVAVRGTTGSDRHRTALAANRQGGVGVVYSLGA
jgi:hypothetical protein